MRKWLLLAAFGLLMQPASATTVTKKIDVPEFTGIVAGSVYDVTLIRSDGCSVEVSYDTRFEDCVRVFVSDGNLVLEFMQPERGRKSRSFDMKDVKLSAVVRMPELTYLRLSGASKLTTGDEFDAGARFDGALSGASSARGLSVSAGRGELRLSGASSADLKARFDEAFLMQLSGASNASVDVRSDDVRMTGQRRVECQSRGARCRTYGRPFVGGFAGDGFGRNGRSECRMLGGRAFGRNRADGAACERFLLGCGLGRRGGNRRAERRRDRRVERRLRRRCGDRFAIGRPGRLAQEAIGNLHSDLHDLFCRRRDTGNDMPRIAAVLSGARRGGPGLRGKRRGRVGRG